MAVMTLLTVIVVVLLYKELKLSTFDPTLAAALGFRPTLLHYGLMVMVSLVAVGAFDAVGSILVVAFFIIPPAAAYLLTDRLPRMLAYSSLIGAAGAYTGYDLARGNLLGRGAPQRHPRRAERPLRPRPQRTVGFIDLRLDGTHDLLLLPRRLDLFAQVWSRLHRGAAPPTSAAALTTRSSSAIFIVTKGPLLRAMN